MSRLTYGARAREADRVRSIGLERWIAQQLAPHRIEDHRADSLVARFGRANASSRDLVSLLRQARELQRQRQAGQRDSAVTMSREGAGNQRERAAQRTMSAEMAPQRALQLTIAEVAAARLTRAVASERQLYELMVDFWSNHFSVFAGKGQTRVFIPAYERDAIRPHAMGKFRDLLGAVAKSPAMLFYLDNAQSIADSGRRTLGSARLAFLRRGRGLNENYARELMELHTLGVDGGYSQTDVVEVARALTGWSIDQRSGDFVFRPNVHDAEAKTVLGIRLAAGRGIEDGEQVLDILARHPSTARHITRKLVVRFVADSAPEQLVERCSGVFTRSDGDIRETLTCIITSAEFFSPAAYRAKVKTPYELVVSSFRAAGATPDGTPRSAQIVARLGQPLYGRQTPDGWPDRADEWMNAGAMVNRVNFGVAMASGRLPGVIMGTMEPAIAAMLTTPEFQRR